MDCLESVIENLLGHATEVVEALLVTGEEERQGLPVGEGPGTAHATSRVSSRNPAPAYAPAS